jgi:hypothetical protein
MDDWMPSDDQMGEYEQYLADSRQDSYIAPALYGRVDPHVIFQTIGAGSSQATNQSAAGQPQASNPYGAGSNQAPRFVPPYPGAGTNQAAREVNNSVVVNANNGNFTSEETDQIYRTILHYEKKNHIKRLITGRKTLEEEERNPRTPTPVTLVQTRLAVVKFMIYYAMLRAEIIKDGPNSLLLIKYLKHRINELLAKYDTATHREERVNLSRTFKVLYDSHLHEKVSMFLTWMRDQLPLLSKENMVRLEANLPTYLFEFELDLKTGGPTKGTKRRFDD